MGNINAKGVHPHHFIDVNCIGNELRLSDCPYNGLTHYLCNLWHDAAIACFNGIHNMSSVSIYMIYYRL